MTTTKAFVPIEELPRTVGGEIRPPLLDIGFEALVSAVIFAATTMQAAMMHSLWLNWWGQTSPLNPLIEAHQEANMSAWAAAQFADVKASDAERPRKKGWTEL